mmetsp:Transcript_2069/g.4386  ORF Transcript_2069/g.4386 Transcript_2069/m.4386 type:complete len:277 (+) Transcript_2069:1973-2803(+)
METPRNRRALSFLSPDARSSDIAYLQGRYKAKWEASSSALLDKDALLEEIEAKTQTKAKKEEGFKEEINKSQVRIDDLKTVHQREQLQVNANAQRNYDGSAEEMANTIEVLTQLGNRQAKAMSKLTDAHDKLVAQRDAYVKESQRELDVLEKNYLPIIQQRSRNADRAFADASEDLRQVVGEDAMLVSLGSSEDLVKAAFPTAADVYAAALAATDPKVPSSRLPAEDRFAAQIFQVGTAPANTIIQMNSRRVPAFRPNSQLEPCYRAMDNNRLTLG